MTVRERTTALFRALDDCLDEQRKETVTAQKEAKRLRAELARCEPARVRRYHEALVRIATRLGAEGAIAREALKEPLARERSE